MFLHRKNRSSRRSPVRRYCPSFEVLEDRITPVQYKVTLLGDAGNADPSQANSGDIRWAVNQSNNSMNVADTIVFNLGAGVQTITLNQSLTITDPVTIDGYSQQGAQPNTAAFGAAINAALRIVLTNGGGVADGIQIHTNDTTIKGLVIQTFIDDAIEIKGHNNKVQGNFLGTNVAGNAKAANNMGVFIDPGSTGNLIGGTNKAYIAGYTDSGDINGQAPDKFGTGGKGDALVVRLTATGKPAEVLVVLGGDEYDVAHGVAVDNADPSNIYVTGSTKASNGANEFPTTEGAFRRTPLGAQDAFVAKIHPGIIGTAPPSLVYSTRFGGSSHEIGWDIVRNPSDDSVYVVGETGSAKSVGFKSEADVGLVPFGFGTEDHLTEGWVARFDANGRPDTQGQVYFGYINAKEKQQAFGVAITPGTPRKLYVTGLTTSGEGFPDKNSLQKYAGKEEAFVLYLDPSVNAATSLVYATYVGGTGDDSGKDVAVDQDANAYVVGPTNTPKNFRPLEEPNVPGLQKNFGGGTSDGFVVKILPTAPGNRRTQLDPIGNQWATVGTLLTFTAQATDPDNDPITYNLEYAPDGATIDPTSGVFEWTPSSGQGPAVWTFVVVASDDGS